MSAERFWPPLAEAEASTWVVMDSLESGCESPFCVNGPEILSSHLPIEIGRPTAPPCRVDLAKQDATVCWIAEVWCVTQELGNIFQHLLIPWVDEMVSHNYSATQSAYYQRIHCGSSRFYAIGQVIVITCSPAATLSCLAFQHVVVATIRVWGITFRHGSEFSQEFWCSKLTLSPIILRSIPLQPSTPYSLSSAMPHCLRKLSQGREQSGTQWRKGTNLPSGNLT